MIYVDIHLYISFFSHLNIVFCLQEGGFGSGTFHNPLYESYRHLTLEIFFLQTENKWQVCSLLTAQF